MDRAAELRRELGVLSEAEVAALLGKTERTLREMRLARTGPPWFKAGATVLYRRAALRRWFRDQECHTS